jgi:hypothetical protein
LASNNGDLYVAYQDVANGKKITVMKYDFPSESPCACGAMGPGSLVAIGCLAMMGARRRRQPLA